MAKKTKVPKKFAGVKLPKALRRDLRDLTATQTGRATLLEALTIATATVAEPKAPRVKAKSVKPKVVKSKAVKPAATKRREPAAKPAATEALVSAESTEAPPLATTPPSTSTH